MSKNAPQPEPASKPKPTLSPKIQADLQMIANVCDSAPVTGPAHRAWQQALDRLANALLEKEAKP